LPQPHTAFSAPQVGDFPHVGRASREGVHWHN
jgi:hypothetical protein